MNVGVRFSSLKISFGIGNMMLCLILSATLTERSSLLSLFSSDVLMVMLLLEVSYFSNSFLLSMCLLPLAITHGDSSSSDIDISSGSNATFSSFSM